MYIFTKLERPGVQPQRKKIHGKGKKKGRGSPPNETVVISLSIFLLNGMFERSGICIHVGLISVTLVVSAAFLRMGYVG